MGLYMSYFETRPIIYLLQTDYQIFKDKDKFFEFINRYPELNNLDREEKDDLYNLLYSYKSTLGYSNIRSIDYYSNNCIHDDTPVIFNISWKNCMYGMNPGIFKREMNLLVNKLGFDINIKDKDNNNILDEFVNKFSYMSEIYRFRRIKIQDIHDHVDILLNLGLKTSVDNHIIRFDDEYDTRVADIINNYNDLDIKEPGYD